MDLKYKCMCVCVENIFRLSVFVSGRALGLVYTEPWIHSPTLQKDKR
jgi:hypothetical protein